MKGMCGKGEGGHSRWLESAGCSEEETLSISASVFLGQHISYRNNTSLVLGPRGITKNPLLEHIRMIFCVGAMHIKTRYININAMVFRKIC